MSLLSALRAAPGARRCLRVLLLAAPLALAAGCASRNALRNVSVQTLYNMAHKAMVQDDTKTAIKDYQLLTSRFPFTPQAHQAKLDLIYVYYRQGDKDMAVDAADDFLRQEPTNPRDDYAWYMKGLIYFEKAPARIARFLGVDAARKPPVDILKAINAFNVVITQYPHSQYAHDARARMIYLRNRLAEYDIYVARYYVRRGAYLAAAQRAHQVIDQYDGAPAEKEALQIMLDCYRRLGLTQLADNVQRVYAANFPPGDHVDGTPVRRWWQF